MLEAVQNPDLETRTQAEAMLAQAAESATSGFMVALVGHLGSDAASLPSRQQAGLYLKNLLHAEDAAISEQKAERWCQTVDDASKDQVRVGLLQCLLSAETLVRHTAAQVIGSLASIDLPRKQWVGPSGLIPNILQCVTNPSVSDECKEAALEACGYVCEELEEGALDPQQTNEILTAIVDGIKAGRPDPMRLAAVRALQNSLDFCGENFGRKPERDMLMTVVCEATQSQDPKVRKAAWECVARVVELFYPHLEQGYMDALYPMTVGAITKDSDEVAMMAVEFWSTLCEAELETEEDQCFGYMAKAMPHLMATLLSTLEKQNEDGGEDDWNLAASAAVCIGLVANVCEDKVVDHVLPYVSASAQLPEWRKREAAIMAFGSILEGPQNESAMVGIVAQAMQLLITSLDDANELVKDTTAWTLARIAELHPAAITAEMVMPLLSKLMTSLDASARVASKGCLVVHRMAENASAIAGGAPWFGPQILGPLLQKLLAVTDREDWEEHNLRTTAYEAINMVVEAHQEDCRSIVVELSSWVFGKLQATFTATILSDDDREHNSQLQALLVATLHYIVMSCDVQTIAPIADNTMQYLLQVLSAKSSLAAEEAFMAAGKLMDKMEGRFDRYLDAFAPIALAGLKNHAEYQVCSAAVGACGDLCRAVESKILPYADALVASLLEALENPALKRDVKPPMLSLLGDLALALGAQFQRYLAPPARAMGMLYQASKTRVDPEDEEMVDYLNELHEGILEAYTGIINGLADGGVASCLLQVECGPGVNAVAAMAELFVKLPSSAMTDEVTKGAVGLIGDVAKILGKPAAPFLAIQTVNPLLNACDQIKNEDEDGPDERAQETAAFARANLQAAHAP